MKYLLSLVCCLYISFCFSQVPAVSNDLYTKWLVFKDNQYKPYETDDNYEAIFIRFDAREGTGDYLQVRCKHPVALFLNQQYLTQSDKLIILSMDSLRTAHNMQSFTISIYSNHISKGKLFTSLLHYPMVSTLPMHALRPTNAIRNFVLIASATILALLIVIVKLNSKLASDYFSVTKIFSLRESEESHVYTRITSSSNFLFYAFSSLTIGFYLTILFTQLPQFRIAQEPLTFQQAIKQWLFVSAVVVLSFIVKMLIVYLFASLFKLREVIGFQFFKWARVLFLLVGFALIIMVTSLLSSTSSPEWFVFFYRIVGWAMAGWLVLVFFKIAAKARIEVFHLFSYLCATEIIPSLIFLKILYY